MNFDADKIELCEVRLKSEKEKNFDTDNTDNTDRRVRTWVYKYTHG